MRLSTRNEGVAKRKSGGRNILAGKNVGIGKDHTLFALKDGKVEYSHKRKGNFDSTWSVKRIVNVK